MVELRYVGRIDGLQVSFVVGVAHSGTTILYRLLGRHPELAWFSQFSQRGGTIPGRFPLPFWGIYNRLSRILFGVPWEKKRGLSEYFIPRPMEANSIWNYLLPLSQGLSADPVLYGRGDTHRIDVEEVRAVVSRELEAWDREKLICKLPALSRAVPLLDEIFDAPRFIHLTRDGRAVAFSNRQKFQGGDSEDDESLLRSARHWKRIVEWLEKDVKPSLESRMLTMKLEEFQSSPDRELSKLFGFLELDENNYPQPLPDLRQDTNSKWCQQADATEVTKVEDEIRETLQALGYNQSWQAD